MTDNKAKALLSEEIEAKAKLFSQYVYQVVLIDPHNPFVKPLYLVPNDFEFRTNLKLPDYSLQLRSVSDLSDEEILEIAVMRGYRKSHLEAVEGKELSEIIKENRGYLSKINPDEIRAHIEAYLKMKGCIAPFRYLTSSGPITISTEEIIKRGWAIVKSKDNGQ